MKKHWFIAIGYVLFIYLTLGFVRYPVNILRSHGLLRLTLEIGYGAAALLIWWTFFRRSRVIWQHVLLLATLLSYIPFSKWATTPEEQIHFFQYGLVGIFFARALRHSGFSGLKMISIALLLGGFAGWIDELIQGALPNRHYDVRDIFLNFLSVFLGLVIYAVFHFPSKNLLNSQTSPTQR